MAKIVLFIVRLSVGPPVLT